MNILRNAIDATANSNRPDIRLAGRLEAGRIVVSVTDNGPGIDDETLEQVFVPFFTTKREGNGIGLSLCRQIMTAHGGEIAIESRSGATTVSLVF